MAAFVTLLCNNLRLEFRLRESILVLSALELLLAAIVAFGVGSAFLDPLTKEKLFPTFLWLIMVLSATVSIGRSFEYDVEHAALDAVLLRGISPAVVFGAKFVSNLVILTMCFVLGACALFMLLGISQFDRIPSVVLSGVPILSAFTLLSTLLAGLTVRSKLRHMLLPLILLPLLFPLFSAAVEVTTIAMGVAGQSNALQWWYLIAGLNALYAALGFFLFEFVVRE